MEKLSWQFFRGEESGQILMLSECRRFLVIACLDHSGGCCVLLCTVRGQEESVIHFESRDAAMHYSRRCASGLELAPPGASWRAER